MKEYFGLIYKVTNYITNKIYIGQTTKPLNKRISGHKNVIPFHKTYFHNALNQYGENKFIWEILGYCDSREELDEAEITCIEFFQSNNKIYGYNLTKGGKGFNGGKHTEASKQKRLKSITGKKHKLDPRYSQISLQSILELRNKNLSLKEIAKILNTGWSIVRNILRMNNIKLQSVLKKSVDLNLAIKLRKKNKTYDEISKELNVSTPTLKKFLKENNIKLKKYERKEIDLDKAIELRKEKKTFKEIGKLLNTNPETIINKLKINHPDLLEIKTDKQLHPKKHEFKERPKRVNLNRPQEIFDLYNSNVSIEEIASKFNYKISTVVKYLNKNGIKLKQESRIGTKNPAYKNIPTNKIIKLHKSGLSYSEIGRRFNVNHHTIISRIKNPEKYLH